MKNKILLEKIKDFINDNWYYDEETQTVKEINVDILLDFINELLGSVK